MWDMEKDIVDSLKLEKEIRQLNLSPAVSMPQPTLSKLRDKVKKSKANIEFLEDVAIKLGESKQLLVRDITNIREARETHAKLIESVKSRLFYELMNGGIINE